MGKFIVVHSIKVATDFTPEAFGRLTTIGPRFRISGNGRSYKKSMQVCQCSCGNAVLVDLGAIKSNRTRSCGCLHSEVARKTATIHGKTGTTEHYSWQCMRQRCRYSDLYTHHAGRGISVHPDWDNINDGFQNFYDYMGPKPTPEHTIDRYPNKDGNYEPGNVRWATRTEQNRNTSRNHFVTYNGKTQCIAEWAEELGIKANTLVCRLRREWTVDRAFTTPERKNQ